MGLSAGERSMPFSPVASMSVTPKHPCHTSMPNASASAPNTSPSHPELDRSRTTSDSGSELDSRRSADGVRANMDISTDSEVQFKQCFMEDQDEPCGDEDDTLVSGGAGSDADDEDSCSSHVCFMEDYVEGGSGEDDEPTPDDLPPTPPAAIDTEDDNAADAGTVQGAQGDADTDIPQTMPPRRPRNRGNMRKKEQGPSNQKYIVNFAKDANFEKDCPVWKHSSSYPRNTVTVPDIAFQPDPRSE